MRRKNVVGELCTGGIQSRGLYQNQTLQANVNSNEYCVVCVIALAHRLYNE